VLDPCDRAMPRQAWQPGDSLQAGLLITLGYLQNSYRLDYRCGHSIKQNLVGQSPCRIHLHCRKVAVCSHLAKPRIRVDAGGRAGL
jgi:hypothetical protein